MDYQDELAELMRERFGPKKARPARYRAARAVTLTLLDLLTETDFPVFLRAALRADGEDQDLGGPHTWSFSEYFDRALRESFGQGHETEGHDEAWHLMRALHDILSAELFSPFLRCAYEAWENTLEVPGQSLAEA